MIEAIAIVDDNGWRVLNRDSLTAELKQLPKGRYRLLIEKKRSKKSHDQLGYLFGAVYPLLLKHLNDAGYEFANVAEVDAFCKAQFASREIVNRNTGDIVSVPGLKREFSTTDMMTFIDAVRNWDAEYLGGYIPGPETQTQMDL